MTITVTAAGSNAAHVNGALSITTTASIPAGSLIIVYTCSKTSSNTSAGTVTDSGGTNSYAEGSALSNSGGFRTAIFYSFTGAAVGSGATFTFTAAGSPTASAASIVYATGINVSSDPKDVQATGTGSSANPTITTPPTTTQAVELWVAMVGVAGQSGDTFTNDTTNGWTALAQNGTAVASASSNATLDPAYQIKSATGSMQFAPTITSRAWNDHVISFKGTTGTITFTSGTLTLTKFALTIQEKSNFGSGALTTTPKAMTVKIQMNGASRALTITPKTLSPNFQMASRGLTLTKFGLTIQEKSNFASAALTLTKFGLTIQEKSNFAFRALTITPRTLSLSGSVTTISFASGALTITPRTSTTYFGPGDLQTAAAYFGLRGYSAAYAIPGNNPCADLRRASDNATMTMNILPNGKADIATVTSWAAGSNVFVTKWYDQSGNARHATQATTANQPQLILATTGLSGYPSLQFNGTSHTLVTGSYASSVSPQSMSAVAIRTSGTAFEAVMTNTVNDCTTLGYDTANQVMAGTVGPLDSFGADNIWHAYTGVFNGSSSYCTVDKNTPVAGTLGSISVSTNPMYIGSNGTFGFYLAGSIFEVIDWGNSALTTNQQTTYNSNALAYTGQTTISFGTGIPDITKPIKIALAVGVAGSVHPATTVDAPAGSLIVVYLGNETLNSDITGLTDSAGNPYTKAVENTITTNMFNSALWYCSNTPFDLPSGGTFTISPSQTFDLVAYLVSNATDVGLVTNQVVQTTGTTSTSLSITPSSAKAVVFSAIAYDDFAPLTFVESSGFTTLPVASGIQNAYEIVSSGGSITYAPSWSNNTKLTAVIASFAHTAPATNFVFSPQVLGVSNTTGTTTITFAAARIQFTKKVTWDAAYNVGLTLSNGNLTATAATAARFAVRSTTSRRSGKAYWEIKPDSGATSDWAPGLVNAVFPASGQWLGGDFNSLQMASNSSWYNVSGVAGFTYVTGDILSWAVDFDNKLIWVRKNGGNWNADATANPATGTGGGTFSFPGPDYFVGFGTQNTLDAATVRLISSSFSYAIPSGFSAWDSAPGVQLQAQQSLTHASLTITPRVLTAQTKVNFASASLTITPKAMSVQTKLSGASRALSFTAQNLTILHPTTISPSSGALTLTPRQANLNLVFARQTLALTSRTLSVQTSLNAGSGGLTLSPQALVVDLKVTFSMIAAKMTIAPISGRLIGWIGEAAVPSTSWASESTPSTIWTTEAEPGNTTWVPE